MRNPGFVRREGCISAVIVQRRECTEEDSRGNQQAAVAEQQQQNGSDSSGGSGIGLVSFVGGRSNVDCSWVRRRLGYGRGAGNDGQSDEVLERVRGQAESGEARHDDAQRRAVRTGTAQACKGCFNTYEVLKHKGVGLNMVIMVLRAGHAAHIRLREIDVSMEALGWQERGEDGGTR